MSEYDELIKKAGQYAYNVLPIVGMEIMDRLFNTIRDLETERDALREQLVKRNAALCNIRDTLLCPQDDSAAISQAYAVAVRTLALSDEKGGQ